MKRVLQLLIIFSLIQQVMAWEKAAWLAELKAVLNETDVPALGVALIDREGLRGVVVAGVRKRGEETKVTEGDLWHLGSCTKAFTSTVAAVLVEDGKIAWTTTVAEVFPKMKIVGDLREATLQQLLSHSAGLAGEIPDELWLAKGSLPSQRMRFAEKMLALPPRYEPGQASEYSNASYLIAGAMLEKVSGKSWEALMAEKIFKPLGMTAVGFGAPEGEGDLAQPWGHCPDPVAPRPAGDNPAALGPAGTLNASLTDWAKFVHWHLIAEGEPLLTKSSTLRHLHQTQHDQYALGWIRGQKNEGVLLEHAGSNKMWYCLSLLNLDHKEALLLVCNQGDEASQQAIHLLKNRLGEKFFSKP